MLLLYIFTLLPIMGAVSCMNEEGTPVSRWEILKFPQSTSYVYSSNTNASTYDLNSTTSGALANTMQQFWLPGVMHAMYNDEPPYSLNYNFSVAHAKAAFVWDTTTTVALFHSIPKFPVGPDTSPVYIGLLENARDYAQHIVCITMTTTEFLSIAGVLSGMGPEVYEGSLPSTTQLTNCTFQPFGSYLLIAKSESYQVDIWSSCVAPYLSTSLEVISWVHGTLDGPACTVLQTTDILDISYSFGVSYSNYDNHAKWGIGGYPLVCFGDLNRVETQKSRGGAVVCWKDESLFDSLQSIIQQTNSCV